MRLGAVEFRGLDQRRDGRTVGAALVTAGEQGILAVRCNRTVILCISDRMSLSIVDGARFMGGVRVASRAVRVGRVRARRAGTGCRDEPAGWKREALQMSAQLLLEAVGVAKREVGDEHG